VSVRNDPQELVARYFGHLEAEQWGEAARLLDPIFLRHYRERETYRPWSFPPASMETYLAHDPDMPREVADYYVRQASRYPSPGIEDYFAGIQPRRNSTT
jgi:hypothetical protein